MIEISITKKAYQCKPQKADYTRMQFEKQTFNNLNDFFNLIKDGHSFCNNMRDENEVFNISAKREDNFDYTHVVVLDLDDTEIEPEVYYQQSTLPPSYLYTSFSNSRQEGKLKYHVLYIFKDRISSKQQFEQVYDRISGYVQQDFPSIQLDSRMRSVAQCTNGTSSRLIDFEEYYGNDGVITYTLSDILSREESFRMEQHECDEKTECPVSNNITNTPYITSLTGQFFEDINNYTIREFIEKYCQYFPYKECTEADFNEMHYQILDDNDAEIWARWRVIGGERKYVRIKRGAGKRFKSLLVHGYTFRIIFPDITDEHLTYCLAVDYYNNFEHDEKYNLYRIFEIAKLCQQYDITKFKPQHQHKYRIDTKWCNENSIKPQSYCQRVRKMLTDEAIAKYYNEKLSIRQNQLILKENGVCVSRGIVARFKNEYYNNKSDEKI